MAPNRDALLFLLLVFSPLFRSLFLTLYVRAIDKTSTVPESPLWCEEVFAFRELFSPLGDALVCQEGRFPVISSTLRNCAIWFMNLRTQLFRAIFFLFVSFLFSFFWYRHPTYFAAV